MNPSTKKDRLGKGLGALLGDYANAVPEGDIRRLPVAAIGPNPQQPRRTFLDSELEELSRSIDQNGLLQPLLVRPAPGAPDRYELVVGERRLRAVRLLGWMDVPAVTRQVDDDTLLVLALVENLQREALNPIEEAQGYHALMTRYELSHSDIARSVGKSRSTVANMLRLLHLPVSVRKLVEHGALSTGHARALLAVEDSVRLAELARRAVEEAWSVREVEKRVRGAAAKKKSGPRSSDSRDPVVRALEEELRAVLATKAHIRVGREGRGTIEVPFSSTDDFERVFQLLTGREASEVVS